jgi:hypothetical protein
LITDGFMNFSQLDAGKVDALGPRSPVGPCVEEDALSWHFQKLGFKMRYDVSKMQMANTDG